VTLFPVKDGSAASSKSHLLWHFGQWHVPQEVIHDGGSEFSNADLTELLLLCGISERTTLAYSKEENAMVERANREVMRHLRNILFDSNIINDWEDHLGAVMSIMNHQKRGQFFPSPVSILFGDVYATQRILAFQQTSTEDGYAPVALSRWADRMIVQQNAIFKTAANIQEAKDGLHMTKFGPPQTQFEPGSMVLAKYHSTDGVVRHRGPPNKFLSNLRGPFKVVSNSRDDYVIRSLVTGKDSHIHVTLLRPFHYDVKTTDLTAIAIRDHQGGEYIDHITGYEVAQGGRLFSRRTRSFWVR
jgi:hypothetical protein